MGNCMTNTTTLPAKLAGRPAVLNALADTVRATGALIEAVSAQVPDETRSVVVEIVNGRPYPLIFGQYYRRPVSPTGPLVPGIVVYARPGGLTPATETR
jgi:hypothetical protein